MTILPRWLQRLPVLLADNPKGPWGGGPDKGGSGDGNEGPRNPWSVPPAGRPRPQGPSALDEFLRRARGNGGGGGSGGARPPIPGAPSPRSLWIIGTGLILLVWVGFTSVHAIAPQQRGVVTYFGKYYGTLDPGYRFTLPAPFADVTKVDVQNFRTENFPEGGGETENLMLTNDRSIMNLSFSVRWNISSPDDYVFQIKDPQATVRATAESAMREVVANMMLDEAIGSGRPRIESQVQDRMQHILDEYKSGIRIQGVAVNKAVAPQAVSEAFKEVTAAQQDAVAARTSAQGYARQLVAKAEGEAAQFNQQYGQYKLAPEVTRRRMYYETMEDVLAKTDKTIVEAPGVMPYLPLPQGGRKLPDPDVTVSGGGR